MSNFLSFFPANLGSYRVEQPEQLAELENWLYSGRQTIVIVGSSVPGLLLASCLGRQAQHDPGLRIVVITGKPPESRRLIDGCSLRRGAVACMARLLDKKPEELLQLFKAQQAGFDELQIAEVVSRGEQLQVASIGVHSKSPLGVGISVRHGQILEGLRSAFDPELPIALVAAEVDSSSSWSKKGINLAFSGQPGLLTLPENHILLNATPNPTLLRPHVQLPAPQRYIVAVQQPFYAPPAGPPYGLSTGMVWMWMGQPSHYLSFIAPFSDQRSTQANWYGVNTSIVTTAMREQYGDEALMDKVRQEFKYATNTLGFDPIDLAETEAAAIIPIVEEGGVQLQRRLQDDVPMIDVNRAFNPGAAVIGTDGMLAAAMAVEAFMGVFRRETEQPLLGAQNGLKAADRALRLIRFQNRFNQWFFFRAWRPFCRVFYALLPKAGQRYIVEDFARVGEN